jgi:cyanophycin synthetase
VLTNLELDNQAERLMAAAGHTAETVLPKGEIFYLRSTANLSTGGTAIDMTDVCHPDNKDMAERTIKAVGLDVGGVDFLTPDITKSYKDIGGAIVEVNAAPGFRMHVAPSEGSRAMSRARSWTCSSRREPSHASRLPRSPAPTARPRPAACWPIS